MRERQLIRQIKELKYQLARAEGDITYSFWVGFSIGGIVTGIITLVITTA